MPELESEVGEEAPPAVPATFLVAGAGSSALQIFITPQADTTERGLQSCFRESRVNVFKEREDVREFVAICLLLTHFLKLKPLLCIVVIGRNEKARPEAAPRCWPFQPAGRWLNPLCCLEPAQAAVPCWTGTSGTKTQ